MKKTEHDENRERIKRIWRNMIARCEHPSNSAFELYGERGIAVYNEWHDFEAFYKWSIQNGYSKELSIDRIDTNGNYQPDNCRWADAVTQANNNRGNHRITVNGENHTIAEWARLLGASYNLVLRGVSRRGSKYIEHCLRDKKLGVLYAFRT